VSPAWMLIPFGLGAVLGWLGGLFGIGGGIIAIPMLGIFFGMDQQLAQGTALVMIVPTVLVGLWRYFRHSRIDARIAFTLAGSASICTYAAARVAMHLDARDLRIAFAGFLVLLAAYLVFRVMHARSIENTPVPVAWPWSSLVGAAGGLLSGMFGVGGAMIAPPALSICFGMSQKEAQGLALALKAPSTVVALITYAQSGEVDWTMGFALAAGGTTCVSAGVALAHQLPENALRIMFCGLICIAAVMLAIRSLQDDSARNGMQELLGFVRLFWTIAK
jgi:uncharacterized membrane protein YfcA